MATHFPSRPFRSYHDGQEDSDNYYDLQSWQDNHLLAPIPPMHTLEDPQISPMVHNARGLIELQNNTIPTAGLEPHPYGLANRVDTFHDLHGISDTILFQTAPTGMINHPLGGWDLDTIFSNELATLPSTFPSGGHPTVNQTVETGLSGFSGLGHDSMRASNFSNPFADEFLMANPRAPYLIAPISDGGYGADNFAIDSSLSDWQADVSSFPIPLAAEYQPSSIPSAYMTMPSIVPVQSLQIRGWDLPLQNEGISPYIRGLPGNQISAETSLSHSTVGQKRDYSAFEPSLESLEPPKGVKKQLRTLLVSPTALSETPQGINNLSRQPPKRPKQGKGPLTSKKREKIPKTRGNACVRCREAHLECWHEHGGVCSRWLNGPKSPFNSTISPVGCLQQYLGVILPNFLLAHLGQNVIKSVDSKLTFTNNVIRVQILTGPEHPPLSLSVSEFVVLKQEALLVPYLNDDSDEDEETIRLVGTLPYALRYHDFDQLKQDCKRHIETISTEEYVAADDPSFKSKLLQAICRFQESDPIATQSSLLRTAIIVYHLHCVKAQFIVFSEDSGPEALKNLQNPLAYPPPPDFLTAIILNSQIKAAFNSLFEDHLKKLIDGFVSELKDKKKCNWVICLCVYLVISLFIDELQVAVDRFAEFLIFKGRDPITVRDSATEFHRGSKAALDHAWWMLPKNINGVKKRFSLRQGFPVGDIADRSKSEIRLIHDLGEILIDYKDDLLEVDLLEDDLLSGQVPEHNNAFRESNRGRGKLVSSILKKLQ